MFDVLRINDTEVKKRYNPKKSRDSNIEKQLNNLSDELSNITFYADTEVYDKEEHFYKLYQKHTNRVINEHIKKIHIWEEEHPDISNIGLVILDETYLYFEGLSIPISNVTDRRRFYYKKKVLHKPWLDIKFMKDVFDSKLKFVVWFMPFKPNFPMDIINDYPRLVIMDTRFSPEYEEYNYDMLVC